MLVLIVLLRLCLHVRKTFFVPVDLLNRLPSFPFYFSTPLPYAIGTCSEDMRHVLDVAAVLKKKPIFICLPCFYGLLGFRIAAKALFTIRETNFDEDVPINACARLISGVFQIYVAIIFILSRIAFLLLRFQYRKFKNLDDFRTAVLGGLFEELAFPRLGCNTAYKILSSMLIAYPSCYEEIIKRARTRHLVFTDSYYCSWIEYLNANQIHLNDKYVVIHTRSYNYHSDVGRRTFRNATLANYIPMMKRLLETGHKVVLIGGSITETLGLQNINLYDLRYGKKHKPCSLDVFLVANCYKYIGMMSGPLDLAILFRRKSFILNSYTPYYCFGYPAETIYLLKHHVINEKDLHAGVSDLLDANIEFIGLNEENTDGYNLIELSAEILLEFCEDFIVCNSRLDSGEKPRWRNVTNLIKQAQNEISENNAVYLNNLVSLPQRERWLSNTILSHDSVSVYEVN